ncbi:hypothetical protein GGR56DRAFT_478918 [Xylariaceae sp. FL0804]|nr:hypothetical protein GGR56DRAFT_478918 [Xylariaceae sp. FL0804]
MNVFSRKCSHQICNLSCRDVLFLSFTQSISEISRRSVCSYHVCQVRIGTTAVLEDLLLSDGLLAEGSTLLLSALFCSALLCSAHLRLVSAARTSCVSLCCRRAQPRRRHGNVVLFPHWPGSSQPTSRFPGLQEVALESLNSRRQTARFDREHGSVRPTKWSKTASTSELDRSSPERVTLSLLAQPMMDDHDDDFGLKTPPRTDDSWRITWRRDDDLRDKDIPQ